MSTFERLEKMLEIVEAMKRNICGMMDAEVKSQLILANPRLSKKEDTISDTFRRAE